MRKIAVTFCTLLCATGLSSLSHATSVISIDNFTTPQRVAFNGEDSANLTLASAGSIGGYRTFSLTSTGNEDDQTSLAVINSVSRPTQLSLSSPVDATANFTVSWAGLLGTGFGPTDLILHEDLSIRKLKFALRSTDGSSNFTWTFVDQLGRSASYTGNFPVYSSSSPNLQYEINLSEFINSGVVNWRAINKISLTGGGVSEVDISLVNGITIIPEPTTALLGALGALGLLRRKR